MAVDGMVSEERVIRAALRSTVGAKALTRPGRLGPWRLPGFEARGFSFAPSGRRTRWFWADSCETGWSRAIYRPGFAEKAVTGSYSACSPSRRLAVGHHSRSSHGRAVRSSARSASSTGRLSIEMPRSGIGWDGSTGATAGGPKPSGWSLATVSAGCPSTGSTLASRPATLARKASCGAPASVWRVSCVERPTRGTDGGTTISSDYCGESSPHRQPMVDVPLTPELVPGGEPR